MCESDVVRCDVRCESCVMGDAVMRDVVTCDVKHEWYVMSWAEM